MYRWQNQTRKLWIKPCSMDIIHKLHKSKDISGKHALPSEEDKAVLQDDLLIPVLVVWEGGDKPDIYCSLKRLKKLKKNKILKIKIIFRKIFFYP
jgi:hypothetical protein